VNPKVPRFGLRRLRETAVVLMAGHAVLAVTAAGLAIAWSSNAMDAGLATGAALLAAAGSFYYFQAAFLPKSVPMRGRPPPPPPPGSLPPPPPLQ